MPHATCNYPFEWLVLDAVAGLCGEDAAFVLFAADGTFRSAPAATEQDRFAEMSRWVAQGTSVIFYDPFDAPEYVWLEWSRVSRAAMERLTGQPFREADFAPMIPGRKPEPPGSFPETWEVMF